MNAKWLKVLIVVMVYELEVSKICIIFINISGKSVSRLRFYKSTSTSSFNFGTEKSQIRVFSENIESFFNTEMCMKEKALLT